MPFSRTGIISSGGGGGDVSGPAVSVGDDIVLFNGITGKVIKDSSSKISDFAPVANGVTNGNNHDHVGGDGAQIDHTGLSNIGVNTHAQIDTHIPQADAHLPSQAGKSGLFLGTNGAASSWSIAPGYVLTVGNANWYSPADNAIVFAGSTFLMSTTEGRHKIYVPKAGTIKAAYIEWRADTAAGTAENISVYIRLNATTDTLIQTVGNTNAVKLFSNTTLGIAVVQGDYFEVKIVCPAWATNPTDILLGGQVYVE